MSEEPIIVLPDEELEEAPPTPPEKAPVEEPVPEVATEPTEEGKFKDTWFDRFGGKAPHYKLKGDASIHGIDREDYRKCENFSSWMKPKRFGLTVEWAERMRAEGKLDRLELSSED